MAQATYNPHNKFGHYLERLIYPVSMLSPIMTVPQMLEIWVNKKVEGVSLSTWGAYALVSGVWAVYGFVHKEKPLAVANSLMFILDSLIVIGILAH